MLPETSSTTTGLEIVAQGNALTGTLNSSLRFTLVNIIKAIEITCSSSSSLISHKKQKPTSRIIRWIWRIFIRSIIKRLGTRSFSSTGTFLLLYMYFETNPECHRPPVFAIPELTVEKNEINPRLSFDLLSSMIKKEKKPQDQEVQTEPPKKKSKKSWFHITISEYFWEEPRVKLER